MIKLIIFYLFFAKILAENEEISQKNETVGLLLPHLHLSALRAKALHDLNVARLKHHLPLRRHHLLLQENPEFSLENATVEEIAKFYDDFENFEKNDNNTNRILDFTKGVIKDVMGENPKEMITRNKQFNEDNSEDVTKLLKKIFYNILEKQNNTIPSKEGIEFWKIMDDNVKPLVKINQEDLNEGNENASDNKPKINQKLLDYLIGTFSNIAKEELSKQSLKILDRNRRNINNTLSEEKEEFKRRLSELMHTTMTKIKYFLSNDTILDKLYTENPKFGDELQKKLEPYLLNEDLLNHRNDLNDQEKKKCSCGKNCSSTCSCGMQKGNVIKQKDLEENLKEKLDVKLIDDKIEIENTKKCTCGADNPSSCTCGLQKVNSTEEFKKSDDLRHELDSFEENLKKQLDENRRRTNQLLNDSRENTLESKPLEETTENFKQENETSPTLNKNENVSHEDSSDFSRHGKGLHSHHFSLSHGVHHHHSPSKFPNNFYVDPPHNYGSSFHGHHEKFPPFPQHNPNQKLFTSQVTINKQQNFVQPQGHTSINQHNFNPRVSNRQENSFQTQENFNFNQENPPLKQEDILREQHIIQAPANYFNQQETYKRSVPFIKLEIPKTVENMVSIAKNSFEGGKSSLYDNLQETDKFVDDQIGTTLGHIPKSIEMNIYDKSDKDNLNLRTSMEEETKKNVEDDENEGILQTNPYKGHKKWRENDEKLFLDYLNYFHHNNMETGMKQFERTPTDFQNHFDIHPNPTYGSFDYHKTIHHSLHPHKKLITVHKQENVFPFPEHTSINQHHFKHRDSNEENQEKSPPNHDFTQRASIEDNITPHFIIQAPRNYFIPHDIFKRSVPLLKLMADPNVKLDMPKTIENIGTVTKNSFEDDKAPMYHIRNMVGSAKNVILAALRIPPQDAVIPTQYKIMDRSELKKSKSPEIVSRFADDSDEDKFIQTFKRIGLMFRESIKSGQEALQHMTDVAHSGRKAIVTTGYATPRFLTPYVKATAIKKDKNPEKLMLIAPRIGEITNQESLPDPTDEYVKVGDIMDALGVSNPEKNDVGLTRFIMHPKKPNKIQSRFGNEQKKNEFFIVAEHIDDDRSENNKFLKAIKNGIGGKSLKNILKDIYDEILKKSKNRDEKTNSKSEKIKEFIENVFPVKNDDDENEIDDDFEENIKEIMKFDWEKLEGIPKDGKIKEVDTNKLKPNKNVDYNELYQKVVKTKSGDVKKSKEGVE